MIDLEAIKLRVWLQSTSSPPDPTLALKQATVDIPALLARVEELTAALEEMVYEHAIVGHGEAAYLWPGCDSATEEAFKVLGWPERQPVPEAWRQ